MEAIGASSGNKETSEEDADMDEESDEDEDDSDDDDEDESESDSDGNLIFSMASKVLNDPEVMDEDLENDERETSVEAGDTSDVEIDPSKLQTMLKEDSDVDIDENMLEHHEGADAALAKLIKLKQDARKAGQQ